MLLFPIVLVALVVGGIFGVPAALADTSPYLGPFHTVTTISSTVPAKFNGDVNPYGLVVVPGSLGRLVSGDVLISNFNNSQNLQGTGTTIDEISPSGSFTVFTRIVDPNCPGGVGLTTALVALQRGWVIVGSLPTTDGTAATAKAGCLIVLDSTGRLVATFAGNGINGPWDMTASDQGSTASLFVTNVLNGTVAGGGEVVNQQTVLRINLSVPNQGTVPPSITSITTIGSGFAGRTDPNALVIGPTGVGLGSNGTLYVADSLNNRIAAIPSALTRTTSDGTGSTVSTGGSINDPLGLTIAPNGDILEVNGNDGNIVEITPGGSQVAVRLLDNTPPVPTGGAGTLFGLAVVPGGTGVYFDDDGDNTLRILQAP
jgi:hypothetical protein